jgi:hypothetical protein
MLDPLARSTFALFGIVERIENVKVQFRSPAGAVGRYGHQNGF